MLRQERIVCDICGRFIGIDDVENGDAVHKFVEPDNHFGPERYESICRECRANRDYGQQTEAQEEMKRCYE